MFWQAWTIYTNDELWTIYTLILKHEKQIQTRMKNRINIHVKKLLIEEKDDTGIFAMKGLSFLCNFIHIYLERLQHITVESLCS